MSSQSPDPLLEEAVARIVRETDPERVILFGSRARGDGGPEADVDFLVVASEETIRRRGRRHLLTRCWAAMGHLPASFDFLLYSPDEVARWQKSLNHVIARALREGLVLYERH